MHGGGLFIDSTRAVSQRQSERVQHPDYRRMDFIVGRAVREVERQRYDSCVGQQVLGACTLSEPMLDTGHDGMGEDVYACLYGRGCRESER